MTTIPFRRISWGLCLSVALVIAGSAGASESMLGDLSSDSGRFQEGFHSGKAESCDDCGSSGWGNAVVVRKPRLLVDWTPDDVVLRGNARSKASVLDVLHSRRNRLSYSSNMSLRESSGAKFPGTMTLRLVISPEGVVVASTVLGEDGGKNALEDRILRDVRRIEFARAKDSSTLDWTLRFEVKNPDP